MKLTRGRLPPGGADRPSVVAIGKFDGLHEGHKRIIEELGREAACTGYHATLVTFEPLPQEYFHRIHSPPRLMRLGEKWRTLAQYGSIDRVVCLRFDHELARQDPTVFVRNLLVEGLLARSVIVGRGFRFGYRRQGDVQLLRELGSAWDFGVDEIPPALVDGKPVSSTRVRTALKTHDFGQVFRLLGRAYSMSGRVIRGDQVGRQLGMPTANISLGRRIRPVHGVYVVQVHGLCEGSRYGVANVGYRPSIDGKRGLLEVYLPNYERNLYGQTLFVEFLGWLRDEQRFDDLQKLRQAMWDDVKAGQEWLARRGLTWSSRGGRGEDNFE